MRLFLALDVHACVQGPSVALREDGILIPQVRGLLRPLLRRQVPPGRRVPGLDLPRRVAVEVAGQHLLAPLAAALEVRHVQLRPQVGILAGVQLVHDGLCRLIVPAEPVPVDLPHLPLELLRRAIEDPPVLLLRPFDAAIVPAPGIPLLHAAVPVFRAAPSGKPLRRLDHVLHLMRQRALRLIPQTAGEYNGVAAAVEVAALSAAQVLKPHFDVPQCGVCPEQVLVLKDVPQLCVSVRQVDGGHHCHAPVSLIELPHPIRFRLTRSPTDDGLVPKVQVLQILRIPAVLRISGALVRHPGIVDLKPPLSVHAAEPARLPAHGLSIRPLGEPFPRLTQRREIRRFGTLPGEEILPGFQGIPSLVVPQGLLIELLGIRQELLLAAALHLHDGVPDPVIDLLEEVPIRPQQALDGPLIPEELVLRELRHQLPPGGVLAELHARRPVLLRDGAGHGLGVHPHVLRHEGEHPVGELPVEAGVLHVVGQLVDQYLTDGVFGVLGNGDDAVFIGPGGPVLQRPHPQLRPEVPGDLPGLVQAHLRRLRSGGGFLLLRRQAFLIGPPLLVREKRCPVGGIAPGAAGHALGDHLAAAKDAAHHGAASELPQCRPGVHHGAVVLRGDERILLLIDQLLQTPLQDALHDLLLALVHHGFHPEPDGVLPALAQLRGQGLDTAAHFHGGVGKAVDHTIEARLGVAGPVGLGLLIAVARHLQEARPEVRILGQALPHALQGREDPRCLGGSSRHGIESLGRHAAARRCNRHQGVGQSRHRGAAVLVDLLIGLAALGSVLGVFLPPLLRPFVEPLRKLLYRGVLPQLRIPQYRACHGEERLLHVVLDRVQHAAHKLVPALLHKSPQRGPGGVSCLLQLRRPVYALGHLLPGGPADAQHQPLPHRCAGRLRRFARLSLSAASRGRCLSVHGPDAIQAAHGVHGLHPVQPLQGVPARRGLGRFPLRGLRRSFPRVIHRLDLIQPVKYICHLSLLRRPGRPESGSVPPGSASRRPRSSSACGPGPG